MSMKKKQVWFKTNLDYDATWKRFQESQIIRGGRDSFGRYTFYFKDPKEVTIQITTHSKLSITCPEKMDFKNILERVKPLLVKADGGPAEILDMIMGPDETAIKEREEKIVLESGERVDKKAVKLAPLIIKELREHPEYKYSYIAEKYRTTVGYVKKIASHWKRGLLKYH